MELLHFSYDEFDSPDYPGSGYKYMDREFVECLDEARDIAENTAIEDIEEAFTDSFLEWKYYAKAAYNNM